jgi:serine/threonine-protein kinase
MSVVPNEGRILGGRYHLVELIGTGAMGQVYRAEDELLGGVVVAIKFLSQTLLNDKMRVRFEREATISALLGEKSIHIIRVRDYGVDENDVPFYVMEFLEGQSLSEMIKFQPLPLKRFLHITRQICLGMDSAHSGIMLRGELCQVVHRDIKPSNILVMQDPTLGELVKILDFGIAKLILANATQTHSFMGTLAYCSPEQMEGKELDNRSDIYSLGVMMYEMLTLEMPILPETSSFGGWYKAHHDQKPRPFESHMKFPPELKKVIMQCMEKNPDARPQTVGEIVRILDSIDKNQTKESYQATMFSSQKTMVADQDTTQVAQDKTQVAGRISEGTSIEERLVWPKSKPVQKIVFPRVITNPNEIFASLWVMLEKQDIINRMSSVRYNQFLFLSSPHPMVLWITVVYNNEYGARWLPCYLDLKTDIGQQMAATLAELGSYKIVFFALEEPEHCFYTTTSTIAANQCKIMLDWVESSKTLPGSQNSQLSKKRLRDEFEKLKPKILMKLKENYNN